jgi:polyhydroxybutyrate depolymerase
MVSNPQTWNDGSGRFYSGSQQVDDVGFLNEVVDDCLNRFPIDPDRIFLTGFSNGASLAFLSVERLSKKIAAIAPVAGCHWGDTPETLDPISIFYLSGTADPLNPLEGGMPTFQFGARQWGGMPKPAFIDFIKKWARKNQCPEKPSVSFINPSVKQMKFTPCQPQGIRVEALLIENLGHVWPGGKRILPEFVVGKSLNPFSATDSIWEFFSSVPATTPQLKPPSF